MAINRSVVVYENDGGALYNYVNSYLSSLAVNPEQPALFRASLIDDNTPLILGLQPGFPVRDKFQGLDFEWSAGVATDESPYVMAAFPPHCSNDVIQAYFSHITAASKRRRLFTVRPPGMHEMSWASCEFDHPASLETLDSSMDAELKEELVKDLEAFVGAQDYYKRIGKAWKRSYLVHGRQASGKEQLVAAIANKLGYDVYDLDTGLVATKVQLKEILMKTGRRAVICVHGIDNQSVIKVKMADVLDVSDGLWAPDERIFVFVSDEAKPDTVFPGCQGRIDFYVAMDTSGFQMLKSTVKLHLGVEDHRLLGEIKGLMMDRKEEVDVGELLALVLGTSSGSYPEDVLEMVAEHLKSKKTKTSPASPSPFAAVAAPPSQSPFALAQSPFALAQSPFAPAPIPPPFFAPAPTPPPQSPFVPAAPASPFAPAQSLFPPAAPSHAFEHSPCFGGAQAPSWAFFTPSCPFEEVSTQAPAKNTSSGGSFPARAASSTPSAALGTAAAIFGGGGAPASAPSAAFGAAASAAEVSPEEARAKF